MKKCLKREENFKNDLNKLLIKHRAEIYPEQCDPCETFGITVYMPKIKINNKITHEKTVFNIF